VSAVGFLKDDMFIVCWEGEVRSYEDYVAFKKHISQVLNDNQSQLNKRWKLVLIDCFPCNTYALGFILNLRQYNKYEFVISTNNYRLIDLLESIEFNKLFELSIEQDPRIESKKSQSPT